MRLLALLVGMSLVAVEGSLAADFPYQAVVTVDEAEARSGPGANYYASSRLSRGEVVEVYRHDPGGWLAIRPPAGSFSWVEEDMLDFVEDEPSLAIVNSDRAVARVGAEGSDRRDVIQVGLERGEVVEVYDRQAVDDGSQTRRWIKIAPPAGEFRWISRRHVRPMASEGAVLATRSEDVNRSREGDVIRVASSSIDSTGEKPIVVTPEEPADDDSDRRERPKRRKKGDGWQPAYLSDSPITTKPRLEGTFSEEVDRLERALAAQVTRDTSEWSFHKLEAEAEALLDMATTPLERGRVRILQGKLARFQEIKRNHDKLLAVKETVDAKQEYLADLRAAQAASVPDESPRFDSTGVLTPVVARKSGDPQFALLDENGKVTAYVTPAPGVNMRAYVGREVGVNGSLGYLAEHNARHVTAKRVELVAPTESIARQPLQILNRLTR